MGSSVEPGLPKTVSMLRSRIRRRKASRTVGCLLESVGMVSLLLGVEVSAVSGLLDIRATI
jgi:hypothetical protein